MALLLTKMRTIPLFLLFFYIQFTSSDVYDFPWSARGIEYTCDRLSDEKEWIAVGDSCLHFTEERFSWNEAQNVCSTSSYSFSTAISQLSWLQLRLIPERKSLFWTALRSSPNQSVLEDASRDVSIYNPSWSDEQPIGDDIECVAIELSQLADPSRGWQFALCDVPLPVICQTFACLSDEFRCDDNLRCVPISTVNDGYVDCLDGSDEKYDSTDLPPEDRNASDPITFYDCPLPQGIGNVEVLEMSGYSLGDTFNWKCGAGYKQHDGALSTCRLKGEHGDWDPEIKCHDLLCAGGAEHGDKTIEHVSSENDELEVTSVCFNGEWITMDFREEENRCKAAPILFGHFTKSSYSYGEAMDIECLEGFTRVDDPICGPEFNVSDIEPCTRYAFEVTSECPSVVSETSFERDWCECPRGQRNDDNGVCTDDCTLGLDSCTGGAMCVYDQTDYRCECPLNKVLYIDNNETASFIPGGSFDSERGGCAEQQCKIEDLNLPPYCYISKYSEDNMTATQYRIGSHEVYCIYDRAQTMTMVDCLDSGEWSNAGIGKTCPLLDYLKFDRADYLPFDIANVTYKSFPDTKMRIMCGGNGEWSGLFPPDGKCSDRGQLKTIQGKVRCACDLNYFGNECENECSSHVQNGVCNEAESFSFSEPKVGLSMVNDRFLLSTNGKVDLIFLVALNAGLPILLTGSSGLQYSFMNLVRDITYYDGNFIRNVIMLKHADGIILEEMTVVFDMIDEVSVSLFYSDTSRPITCNNGLQLPLEHLMGMDLMRKSIIVNIQADSPNTISEEVFEYFVENEHIFISISDEDVNCPSQQYESARRLVTMTSGFYSVHNSVPFLALWAIPKLYKSVVVSRDRYENEQFVTGDEIHMEDGAQTIMIYAFSDQNIDVKVSSIDPNYNPLPFVNGYDALYYIHNDCPIGWTEQYPGHCYLQSQVNMNWDDAVQFCESKGATLYDFSPYCGPIGSAWIPLRMANNGKWKMTYKGVSISIDNFERWDVQPTGNILQCAAFKCRSQNTGGWIPTDCDDQLPALCQKSAFDMQKTNTDPTDFVREANSFRFDIDVGNDLFFHARVQSNSEIDFHLIDEYGDSMGAIESGYTRLDIIDDGNHVYDFTTEISPNSLMQSDEQQPYLVCNTSYDAIVKVSKNNIPLYYVSAPCLEVPHTACSSTGCIEESTSHCIPNHHDSVDCICRDGYSGEFCEVWETSEEEICDGGGVNATMNYPQNSSLLMLNQCGCSSDGTNCPLEPSDPCGTKCSVHSNCELVETEHGSQKFVYSCICDAGWVGEFCEDQVLRCDEGYTGFSCEEYQYPCSTNQCLNGGTCYNLTNTQFFCFCVEGFKGDLCEDVDDNYWSDDGVYNGCYNLGHREDNGTCYCTAPWIGSQCTVLGDENVCGCERGTCVYAVEEHTLTSCTCPYGWIGDWCGIQFSYEDISPSPCYGNSTLSSDGPDGYNCECDDYHNGSVCGIPLCQNGGDASTGQCKCPPGFDGAFCELQDWEIDCPNCKNGGQCELLDNATVCNCTEGFIGEFCQEVEISASYNSYNLKITPELQDISMNVNLQFDSGEIAFTICTWIRVTPSRYDSQAEYPIFQLGSEEESIRFTTKSVYIEYEQWMNHNLRFYYWQYVCLMCLDSTCNVYLNGDQLDGSENVELHNFKPTLIIAPHPIHNETQLQADINRFSIFPEPLSKEDITELAYTCASSYNRSDPVYIAADQSWTDLLKSVSRSALISPGLCENAECFPGTQSCTEFMEANGKDKTLPIAYYCPDDVYVDHPQSIQLRWDEPIFVDDDEFVSVTSNYNSGDFFTWGGHHIVYEATDSSGNVVFCEFDIYVAPNKCEDPQPPAKGNSGVLSTFDGESGSNRSASVHCESTFPLDGPLFYTCDYMGQWHRSRYSPTLQLPECGDVEKPIQILNGFVYFNDGDCVIVREEMDGVLSNLCECEDCTYWIEECMEYNDDNITSTVVYQNSLEYTVNATADDLHLEEEINALFKNLTLIWNVTTDMNLQCDSNSPNLFQSDAGQMWCAEVTPGHFFDTSTEQVFDCPINTYQNESSQTSCEECPDDKITQSPGATRIEDCYDNCSPGSFYNFSHPNAGCLPCPVGSFTSRNGSLYCSFCEDGMTTHFRNSTSASDCYWKCELGEEMDGDSNKCVPCSKGFYKDSYEAKQCTKCPDGTTTKITGATSKSSCTVLDCPINMYANTTADVDSTNFNLVSYCVVCEMGTMRTKSDTNCTDCPEGVDVNDYLFHTCNLMDECKENLGCADQSKKCEKNVRTSKYMCVVEEEPMTRDESDSSFYIEIIIIAVSVTAAVAAIGVAGVLMIRYWRRLRKSQIEEDISDFSQRRSTEDLMPIAVPDAEPRDNSGIQSHGSSSPATDENTSSSHDDQERKRQNISNVKKQENSFVIPPVHFDVSAAFKIPAKSSDVDLPIIPSHLARATVDDNSFLRDSSKILPCETVDSLQVPRPIISPHVDAQLDFEVPSVSFQSDLTDSSFTIGGPPSDNTRNQLRRPSQIVKGLIRELQRDRL